MIREHLQQFLDRKRTCLPEMEDSPLKAVSSDDPGLISALETQASAIASQASHCLASASSTDQPQAQVQPELSNGGRGQEMELASFLKRQMFGRPHLELLRVKVLHAV